MTDGQTPDIELLISRHLDGELSPEELAVLQAWLRDDPANADHFARHAIDHHRLHELNAVQPLVLVSDGLEKPLSGMDGTDEGGDISTALQALSQGQEHAIPVDLTSELRQRQLRERYLRRKAAAATGHHKEWSLPRPVLWLAAAAVLGLIAWLGMPETHPQKTPDSVSKRGNSPMQAAQVAFIRSENAAYWRQPVGSGSYLLEGAELHLDSGTAEIVFGGGSSVIIEGPAVFVPQGGGRLQITRGQAVVQTNEASAFPLIVQTPGGLLTHDMGEFGIAVDRSGQSFVNVFSGTLSVDSSWGQSRPASIQAGGAFAISSSGQRLSASLNPNTFVREKEYLARFNAEHSAYDRWFAQSCALRRNPHVVLYYAFEQEDFSENTIRNLAVRTDASDSNGVANLAGTGPGRFRHKPAARFSSDGHYVAAVLDRPLEAITLAGWYWIEEMSGKFTALLHTNGTALGGIHWHLNANHGGGWSFEFVQIRERRQLQRSWFDALSSGWSPQSITGRWVHLALVYDTRDGFAELYVDGQQVTRTSVSDGVPIRLSAFRLGNWYASVEERNNDWPRPLSGRIDEFVVLDRAMTQQEVAGVYDSGRPEN